MNEITNDTPMWASLTQPPRIGQNLAFSFLNPPNLGRNRIINAWIAVSLVKPFVNVQFTGVCWAHVVPDIVIPHLLPAQTGCYGRLWFRLPNDPIIVGVRLQSQTFGRDPMSGRLTASNAFELTVQR